MTEPTAGDGLDAGIENKRPTKLPFGYWLGFTPGGGGGKADPFPKPPPKLPAPEFVGYGEFVA